MCAREPDTSESREKRYVESDLPQAISSELAKSEPPPPPPIVGESEMPDSSVSSGEKEEETPQVERRLSNKSRFYKEKHDPSDQFDALSFGEGGQKADPPPATDILGKKTQKREEQCVDALGSTEFSEVSITDSLINSKDNANRLQELCAV